MSRAFGEPIPYERVTAMFQHPNNGCPSAGDTKTMDFKPISAKTANKDAKKLGKPECTKCGTGYNFVKVAG